LVLPFLAGSGAVLLPGFCMAIWIAWKKQNRVVIAMALWLLGIILLYAERLPVNYQHGRYMMPAMGIYFTVGIWGMAEMISRMIENRSNWVLKRVWIITLALTATIFLWLGGRAYQTDVAIIETEMVQTARWIEAHTPSNSLVAAHDIGAMGYFAHRPILDLAGLVNPEVIPIIRNEQYLKEYMDSKSVDYVVSFPAWYPYLLKDKKIIFQSTSSIVLKSGGENMAVYTWQGNN
jgi:hypothetical protein